MRSELHCAGQLCLDLSSVLPVGSFCALPWACMGLFLPPTVPQKRARQADWSFWIVSGGESRCSCTSFASVWSWGGLVTRPGWNPSRVKPVQGVTLPRRDSRDRLQHACVRAQWDPEVEQARPLVAAWTTARPETFSKQLRKSLNKAAVSSTCAAQPR